jgi:hypothetical protein
LNLLIESLLPGGALGLVIAVVLSNISMIHFESREISRELKGRTRTATLTDDIFALQFFYSRLLDEFDVLAFPQKFSFFLLLLYILDYFIKFEA